MLASITSRSSLVKSVEISTNLSARASATKAFSRFHKPRHLTMERSFFSSRTASQPLPNGALLWRSFASYHHPSGPGSVRSAIYLIIGLNTAVFATWQYAQYTRDFKIIRMLEDHFLLSQRNLKAGRYWTLLTSSFSHFNVAHFAFNMMSLNAFGSALVWTGMGAVQFLTLTAGSALVGSLAMLYHYQTRRGGGGSALGASDAVMGIGAAATCVMPFSRWNVMFIPVAIPLWLLTGLYVAVDTYFLDSEKIGHAAHLGGTVFGAVYYLAFLRNYGGIWFGLRRFLRR